MNELIRSTEKQLKCGLKDTVDARIREFKELGRRSGDEIFKELCFCILTANFTAAGGIRIQKEIGDGFLTMPESDLAVRLKELGHRFPNTRARYIAEARRHKESLEDVLKSYCEGENVVDEVREWLVENIKGIGYKEASHFLRNIGFENVAIIDFHIIDILANHGLIEKPKSISKGRYLEIEGVVKKLADELGITLAELDLYLWCAETGKVLK